MAWAALTVADVESRIGGLELQGLRERAVADGQADPLPEVIIQVTDEVRGYIAAGGVQLGPAGTLPPQISSSALAMIRWRLGGRLSAPGLQTESRRKEYEDALQQCRDVASRKFVVETPQSAGPETIPTPVTAFGGKTKLTW